MKYVIMSEGKYWTGFRWSIHKKNAKEYTNEEQARSACETVGGTVTYA